MDRRSFLAGLGALILSPELIVEPRRKLWPGWSMPVLSSQPLGIVFGSTIPGQLVRVIPFGSLVYGRALLEPLRIGGPTFIGVVAAECVEVGDFIDTAGYRIGITSRGKHYRRSG